MWQHHNVVHCLQPRIYAGAVFIDIKPRTGQLTAAQHAGQGIFIDHFSARGIHNDRIRLHQFQAACIHQMKRRRRMRTINRDNIHPRHHLIEALPIGRLDFLLYLIA